MAITRSSATITATVTGFSTEVTLLDIKRSVTDFRTLLDYDVRTDGNPVYVGKNLQAVLTSAATWVVQKLFYDSSNRLIDAQVLAGTWDGRAAFAWKPAGGN